MNTKMKVDTVYGPSSFPLTGPNKISKEMTKEDADGVDANKEMPEVEGAKKAESTEESIENTNTGNNSNQTKSNTQ